MPPAQTISAGKRAAFVVTSVVADEQADLSITVVDAKGRPLSAKPLGYRVLGPRVVPLKLRVPTKLLARRGSFRIRIVAREPQGNRSTLYVPFPA